MELYNQLIRRLKKYKRFGISPAFVLDRGASNTSCKCNNELYNPYEEADFIINLKHKYNIHSPFLHYPSRFFTECAIRNTMSVSFDPEGFAYKCWEVIGNKNYSIGKLNNGKLENINDIILNRQLYGADPLEDPVCSKCNYLPICCGGCPIQRIENVFDHKKNNTCTYYKGKLEDFLKIHMSLKKIGIENKND